TTRSHRRRRARRRLAPVALEQDLLVEPLLVRRFGLDAAGRRTRLCADFLGRRRLRGALAGRDVGAEPQQDVAELELVAVAQRRALHALRADPQAVARARVGDPEAPFDEVEARVVAADRRIGQARRALLGAAEHGARAHVEALADVVTGEDEDLGH